MGDRKLIIGLTGTNSSGKDTVADYLVKEKGFENHYSFSGEIKIEAAKRHLDYSRETLHKLGNEMRGKFGPNYWGNVILSKLQGDRVLITGIRNPAEAEVFKKNSSSFILIGVDAPVESRYKWSQSRARDGEHTQTFEEFKKIDDAELYGGETKKENEMFTAKCLKMADYLIINDGTLEDLKKKTDKILLELISEGRSTE